MMASLIPQRIITQPEYQSSLRSFLFVMIVLSSTIINAFTISTRSGQSINNGIQRRIQQQPLFAYRDSMYTKRTSGGGGSQNGPGRGGASPDQSRSKRQERVGQLVSIELGKIIHSGLIKGRDVEYFDDELRQRISVVKTDISPDLRQARVSISIRGPSSKSTQSIISPSPIADEDDEDEDDDDNDEDDDDNDDDEPNVAIKTPATTSSAVDKRRAYSWLVRNTKPIRHTLAQRMSHMKMCPTLQFVQVDVAAAVDVMYLIDKAVAGQQRTDLPLSGSNPDVIDNFFMEDDEDDEEDEEDGFAWEDVNDEFFKKK